MSRPCFCMLLRQAARKSSATYDEALAPIGVSVAQFSLLRKIERKGSVSITELAELADLDRSTIGRNTKVLQKVGWVKPTDSVDQREATFTLTPEGKSLLDRGAPLWDQAQDKIEAALGVKGVDQLEALLKAL